MQLTESNYYSPEADKDYMSVSQYKKWIECESAAYHQYIIGDYKPETTDAMLAGSYFHSLFDGTSESFLQSTPELLTAKGQKTAAVKQLDDIYSLVSKDRNFMVVMTGEHEQIITADLFGITWKIKPDVVNKELELLTDLKTCKSFEYEWSFECGKKVPFYINWKYDLQLAIYQAVYYKAYGIKLQPHIAAVTKEIPPDHEVYAFIGEAWEDRFCALLNTVEMRLPRIMDIKQDKELPNRCNSCAYCRQTKKIESVKIAEI